MFDKIFKKKNNSKNIEKNHEKIMVAALLVHAARMDENYTEEEKKIIKKALYELFKLSDVETSNLLISAEKFEEKSNQIIEYTREIKNYKNEFRIKVIEILWKIIFSDGKADMYEANLMRRLSGLLYLSDKEVGEIKSKFNKI